MNDLKILFSVGFFLAFRDIRHSNFWTTFLIISVMALTFLNMILIGGILLGLAQGMTNSSKQYYSSDLLITPSADKYIIEQTNNVTHFLDSLSEVSVYSLRLTSPAKIEFNYHQKTSQLDIVENTSGVITGINPLQEDKVTQLSQAIIEGSYLTSNEPRSVLMGKDLFEKYSNRPDSSGGDQLTTATVGSKILISVNGKSMEFIIKGIISTNNQTIDSRIFMLQPTANSLLDQNQLNASEIAIKLNNDSLTQSTKEILFGNLNNASDLTIQTAIEAVPGKSADITKTFRMLGNLVGVIALIVGAVTIFIVIFVNAITRRKYIGILKGIGISAQVIEISYVMQAFFYALAGVVVATFFILGFLKPFLDIHPLTLPIAQGRLAVTTKDLLIRGVILIITSLISGFVPAHLVTKQNTLDSILGR